MPLSQSSPASSSKVSSRRSPQLIMCKDFPSSRKRTQAALEADVELSSSDSTRRADRPLNKKKRERLPDIARRIPAHVLRPYLNVSLAVAAKALGISATTLKRLCRHHGIKRWPYRQISSMHRKVGRLEAELAASKGHLSSGAVAPAITYVQEIKRLEMSLYRKGIVKAALHASNDEQQASRDTDDASSVPGSPVRSNQNLSDSSDSPSSNEPFPLSADCIRMDNLETLVTSPTDGFEHGGTMRPPVDRMDPTASRAQSADSDEDEAVPPAPIPSAAREAVIGMSKCDEMLLIPAVLQCDVETGVGAAAAKTEGCNDDVEDLAGMGKRGSPVNRDEGMCSRDTLEIQSRGNDDEEEELLRNLGVPSLGNCCLATSSCEAYAPLPTFSDWMKLQVPRGYREEEIDTRARVDHDSSSAVVTRDVCRQQPPTPSLLRSSAPAFTHKSHHSCSRLFGDLPELTVEDFKVIEELVYGSENPPDPCAVIR